MVTQSKLLPLAAMVSLAAAGSIADIEHVVLFMQENRAFDHYYGTMAGVRGYSDPNAQVNYGNTSVWQQQVNSTACLLPWYLNHAGGVWVNATQCMTAGSNAWGANHKALNNGTNDMWAIKNTPYSWGYYKRSDIPVLFSIAEGWTIADMYQEGVIASTSPNRVTWTSGSINTKGSLQDSDYGGPYLDNNETPGCDSDGINCYPLEWETVGEIYQDQGVTWQVFQDADNFDDNPFAWFKQFQSAATSSELYSRGMQGQTLDTFYARAANGTLPRVSYIVGPTQLSEHPPMTPGDGAWLQRKVVEAVTSSPAYKSTVLLISYDETGGWGDHVVPYHAPGGTAGEWMEDVMSDLGYVYTGPGFRVPFYAISPWSRGGHVFTEHADHNSQILFVEKWLETKGVNVTASKMTPWRREHMSDLTAMFDFDHPDYSLPAIPDAVPPHTNSKGVYDGSSYCQSQHSTTRPGVLYSSLTTADTDAVAHLSEDGFKEVRGQLTEGRYLVFESGAQALANPAASSSASSRAVAEAATARHETKAQRWVVHAKEIGGSAFQLSSALDGRYLTSSAILVADAAKGGYFTVSFVAGQGYAFKNACGQFLALRGDVVVVSKKVTYWKAYSVTYSN